MRELRRTGTQIWAGVFSVMFLAVLTGCATPPSGQAHTSSKSAKTGQHVKECRNCPELVVLPAGSFMMGSPPEEPERRDTAPQHRVTIARPFAMAATPITWNQWEACVRDRWCEGAAIDVALRTNPDGSCYASYRDYGRGTRPAVGMSWYDAQTFVGWLNWKTGGDDLYRLPSESEWEYAARAGTTTAFPWGNELTTTTATSVCANTASSAASPKVATCGWTRRRRSAHFRRMPGACTTCMAMSSRGRRTVTSRFSRLCLLLVVFVWLWF